MRIPKIKRKTICAKCLSPSAGFPHDSKSRLFGHKFEPRLETIREAAYRQGYEEGYERAESKAHWNSGGISWN